LADLRKLLQNLNQGGGGITQARLYSEFGGNWLPVSSNSNFGTGQPHVHLVDSGGFSLGTSSGRLKVESSRPGADLRRNFVNLTTVTETLVLTGVSGNFMHVTAYAISNRSATEVTVDILTKPGGAGTAMWSVYVPPTTTIHGLFPQDAMRANSQEGVSAKLSADVDDVIVNLIGYVDTD
jgi:hypothetical protein